MVRRKRFGPQTTTCAWFLLLFYLFCDVLQGKSRTDLSLESLRNNWMAADKVVECGIRIYCFAVLIFSQGRTDANAHRGHSAAGTPVR